MGIHKTMGQEEGDEAGGQAGRHHISAEALAVGGYRHRKINSPLNATHDNK
jgi:hypothetical protein